MRLKQFARQWVLTFIDPRKLLRIVRLPGFIGELLEFRRMAPDVNVPIADLYPCLGDRVGSTPFDPHYFFQAAWLARCLVKKCPPMHVDVGSSINMLSVLSAYQPTVFLDYRPLLTNISNLTCVAGTVTDLPFANASVESLSCLHVVEHIGLGRYGDPLDAEGSAKACAELARVVRPGGKLYLSVPVGRERVCFNAHRVFSPDTIIASLPGMKLLEFSLVDDAGEFHFGVLTKLAVDLDYGCGLFEFERENVKKNT